MPEPGAAGHEGEQNRQTDQERLVNEQREDRHAGGDPEPARDQLVAGTILARWLGGQPPDWPGSSARSKIDDPSDLSTTQIAEAAPLRLRSAEPAASVVPTARLAEALGQRTSVLGYGLPVWGLLSGVAAVAASVGFMFGLAAASGTAEPAAQPLAAARTSSAPGVEPPASVARGQSAPGMAERAALGEQAAMAELEQRPVDERSVEQSIALARGRERQRHAELEALSERLRSDGSLAGQSDIQKQLLAQVVDPRVAVDALRVIATLPGTIGPDLLYQVWTGTRDRNDATVLAESLVSSAAVRARASEALSVALDLRRAEECQEMVSILPRAIEHGDRRSLRLLGRLLGKRGCGARQTEDCYACLRGNDQLTEAIDAVKQRPPPEW